MTFTLTQEHVESILGPAAQGDWEPFAQGLDPEVEWWIGADTKDQNIATGVYNYAQWKSQVNQPLLKALKGNVLNMGVSSIEVIGNKAIAECFGTATQLNGEPYNNMYCWILIFDDRGKIVKIREYLNTALVGEVHKNAGSFSQ